MEDDDMDVDLVSVQDDNRRGSYNKVSLEDRRRLVDAMMEGGKLVEICKVLKIKYKTGHGIWTKYNKTDSIDVKKRGGKRPKLLDDAQREIVREWVDEDCTLTLNDLQDKIGEELGIQVGPSTVNNYITGFGYTFKRLVIRTIPAMTDAAWQQRREYAMWFLQKQAEGRSFMFLDETGFQISMRVSHGRAHKGQTPQYEGSQSIRSKNVTVMACCSNLGMVHYEVLRGNGNALSFIHFIDNLAHEREAIGLPNNAILIMDNVSFHKTAEAIEMMELRGIYKFLPPYSPFFNPIENLFSKLKHFVKVAKPQNNEQLMNAIVNANNNISVEDCVNYIRHGHMNAVRCVNGDKNLI